MNAAQCYSTVFAAELMSSCFFFVVVSQPLSFCLKVLGFHQLKKSRQGQGR